MKKPTISGCVAAIITLPITIPLYTFLYLVALVATILMSPITAARTLLTAHRDAKARRHTREATE